jgi:hypothetical protein
MRQSGGRARTFAPRTADRMEWGVSGGTLIGMTRRIEVRHNAAKDRTFKTRPSESGNDDRTHLSPAPVSAGGSLADAAEGLSVRAAARREAIGERPNRSGQPTALQRARQVADFEPDLIRLHTPGVGIEVAKAKVACAVSSPHNHLTPEDFQGPHIVQR